MGIDEIKNKVKLSDSKIQTQREISVEFITAKCPNCGGDLRLPDDKKQVKCMYCNFDIIVHDAVNAAQVNVENLLRLGTSAQEVQNYQEAYDYFTKALEYDADNYLAQFGKGFCAAKLSTPEKFRFDELKTGIVNGVNNAPEDKKEELKAKAVKELIAVSEKNERSKILTNKQKYEVFEILSVFEPTNENLLENIIHKLTFDKIEREKYLNKLEVVAPERTKSLRNSIQTVDSQWREENIKNKKQERFQRKIKKSFGKIGDILVIVLPIIITLGVIFFCAIFCRTGR